MVTLEGLRNALFLGGASTVRYELPMYFKISDLHKVCNPMRISKEVRTKIMY